jgi:mannosyltransferase OCH1-like enzyme
MSAIPRILHQTWKTREVPERFRGYVASWRRHHPDWEYRLWTDADNDDFIRTRYPDFLGTFRASTSTSSRRTGPRAGIFLLPRRTASPSASSTRPR